jgi:broad specificity phosphatase PhoE
VREARRGRIDSMTSFAAIRFVGWLALAAAFVAPGRALADEALWNLLAGGGHVVMIRHAITVPGVGDPRGMRRDDCASQRNLSDEGRRHARDIGAAFRAQAIAIDRVVSSPWCRCIETATLAFGATERDAALGNLFGRHDRATEQVEAMRTLVSRHRGPGNLVLVSHGSTIAALTGVAPAPGELVVLRAGPNGDFRVVGRMLAHRE